MPTATFVSEEMERDNTSGDGADHQLHLCKGQLFVAFTLHPTLFGKLSSDNSGKVGSALAHRWPGDESQAGRSNWHLAFRGN